MSFTNLSNTAELVYRIRASEPIVKWLELTHPICLWQHTDTQNEIIVTRSLYTKLGLIYDEKH